METFAEWGGFSGKIEYEYNNSWNSKNSTKICKNRKSLISSLKCLRTYSQ